MRILSLTAQKPDSTGSGVFLTELLKGFASLGCDQAVVFGTIPGEARNLPEGVMQFPVTYGTPELPFPVCGMSDEMPYESTRYRDLSEGMSRQLMGAFRRRLTEAVEAFRPDVIYCHHLYFLAALARELFPELPVWGQCHGSDLRQLGSNAWQADWIKENIRKLSGIFALHEVQKQQICDVFQLPEDRVTVMGTGYNSRIFFPDPAGKAPEDRVRYLFAGKISDKKGVGSLIRCLSRLEHPERCQVLLAGGGSEKDLERYQALAAQAPCPVTFLGKLDQTALADQMRRSDVFVLPSFYEGLPLVLIEAMACGMGTICTDLPGIQPWLNRALPEHGTLFVAPPRMRFADEPVPGELPGFEVRLARAMELAPGCPRPDQALVAKLSWSALCGKILSRWSKI